MHPDEIADCCVCCACGGRIDRVNLVELCLRATWKFPRGGNVLTGEDGRAIAVCCDRCAEGRAGASLITKAVEFRGDEVIYHDVADLEELPPPQSYMIVGPQQGRFGIHCLRCGSTSWHPGDVEHKYCATCKQFH